MGSIGSIGPAANGSGGSMPGSVSTSRAGIGRAIRKPWPRPQPMSRSASSCSARSMPSATTSMPSSRPTWTIVRVSMPSVGSWSRPATKDGSILMMSTGSCRR